jgi:uncharacterized delta-60 repeat protein
VADIASSLAIDKTGKIVIGGLSATGSASDDSLSSDFLVARYTPTGALDRTFSGGTVITSFGQPAGVSQILIQSTGSIIASGKTVASLDGLDPSQLDVAVARYTAAGKLDTTFNTTGTAIISLNEPSASPNLVGSALRTATSSAMEMVRNADPTSIEPFELTSFSVIPADTTSTLLAEFAQFQQSSQGVVAVTQGGELLDVGNSGANTVEAAIVTAGIDLATTLLAKLPMAALEGARGTLSVKITNSGVDLANGSVSIQLYASPDGQLDVGLTPFKTYPERVNLKPAHGSSFLLHYALPATAGNFYVVANVVPVSASLSELNTNNNDSASQSPVQVAPPFVDLSGSALTSIATPAAGKFTTIDFTVANNGNILAKPAPVQILASPDGTVASGTQIAEPKVVFNLAPSTTRKYHLTFRVPTTLPANTYVLVAVLDPGNSLNDPNLADNILVGSTQFVVP